jgi:hypothetical protein
MLAGSIAAAEQHSGEHLKRAVVSGGVLRGSSESYRMTATAAQAMTNSGSSESFELSVGFWPVPAASGGCCGMYNDGFTGNANCDAQGDVNLADITRLIDRVYISKLSLCCEENGDTNGDGQGPNLSDITRLIDHVYISKQPTAACL